MKWPEELAIIRHGESAYNILRDAKANDPGYQEFKAAYEIFEQTGAGLDLAQELARTVMASGICSLDVADHATPLTERGHNQAEATGRRLAELIKLPDVVLVSPYVRTHQTVDGLIRSWPELAGVARVEDDRLREQEHGLSTIYGDWRIYQTLHPDQEILRKKEGTYWYKHQQGENVPMVRDRLRSIQNTLTREYVGQRVLIVAHHLTLLAFRANMERLGAEQFIHLDENEKPVNCGVTIYDGDPDQGRDGKLILREYNTKLYSDEEVSC